MTYNELQSTDDLSVSVPNKINGNFRRARFLNGASHTADFTVFDDDTTGSLKDIYYVSTGASTIIATLPDCTVGDASNGRIVTFVKTDSGAGSVRITADGSQTVNGASFVSLSTQYESKTVASDGTEWFEI